MLQISSRWIACGFSLLVATGCVTKTSSSSDAMSDAVTNPSDASACTTLDLATATNAPKSVRDTAAPTPAGGTLQDGTYVLADTTLYTPDTDAGAAVPMPHHGLLRVQGTQLELIVAFETGTPSFRGTYSIAGTNITMTAQCPAGNTPATTGFTASATDIRIFTVVSSALTTEQHFRKL